MRTTAAGRWGVGIAACAAIAVAGCGSSSGGSGSTASSSSSAGSGGGASASGGVAAARKELATYRGVPTFNPGGPAFDARKAAGGRTLLSIPASSSIPFVSTLQAGVKALAPSLGMTFLDWPNQGRPVDWVQGMNAGVSRKVAAINLMAGINPASLGPQVQQAQAAKIPVIASHLYDVGDTPTPAGIDTVSVHYEQAGRLLADWVVDRTGGKADTLMVKIDEVVSSRAMMRGIDDVFQQDCSGCKTSTINVAISDVATRIQPQVQASLTKDPNIRYVIALYDSAEAPFVVSAIKQSGAASRVKVVTYNGTPSVLRLVKSGDVEMDIGENLEWISYAITDQAMRLMGGLPPVADPHLPLRVFDRGNVDATGNPPTDNQGFGDAYKAGYRKLWGLGG